MEDAISQLQDLGVTRGQAKKALARYNNDVARAADFIFSGNFISDDEEDEVSKNQVESDEALAIRLSTEDQAAKSQVESDEAMALRLSAEEEEAAKYTSPSTGNVTKVENNEQPPLPPPPIQQHDSSTWSVVPFKPAEHFVDRATVTTTTATTPIHTPIESLLTWWKDPEDPSDRIALDDLPAGLRPPSYNFAYSPVLLQALFHVTAFQKAVLSFRPVPYAWGAPKNYWKGFGEPVPGYIMREVVTRRPVVIPTTSAATPHERTTPSPPVTPPAPATVADAEQDLISFDKLTIADESDKSNEDDINENILEDDLPPQIIENADVVEEETVQYEEHIDNELQLMPKSLQALSEMQKIFGFLGNTKRLYGSASHYVRALNTKVTSGSNWEFSDKTFEAFVEMVIGCLVDADEQSDNASDPHFVPIFRNLFLVKAKIEYGDDYEDEEVYYITLNTDKNMCTFHDCLDPLVFESYEYEKDMEADPELSDTDDDDNVSFKLTTFRQTPPILLVVLDQKPGPKADVGKYYVDKTIYMDRYLLEKRDTVLEGFKKMEVCRREIAKATSEMNALKNDSSLSMDKRDILLQTMAFFEDSDEVSPEDLESIKTVLSSVKDSIEQRLEKLEDLVVEQREKIRQVFDTDDMKEKPYHLRASFHTDGKSGTGHYWAYIWVEPSQQSLLEDIPTEGGWFKFCDAHVTAATEYQVLNDPVPPFSVMYVSADIPQFSKEEIYECLPDELKEFITADNQALDAEIYAYDHPNEGENFGDASLISTSDDVGFTERTDSHVDIESCSVNYDDSISVGTAVAHNNDTANNNEAQQYSFTGQGFNKLKERVNNKIIQVAAYPKDDYRLLKSFENFLARTQNQLLLEHLYLLYSSDQFVNHAEDNHKGDEPLIDEEGSKKDDDLKMVWDEYEVYLGVGEMIVQALSYFVKKEFSFALQSLLDAKRLEASWKTQVMLDMDISNAFSGLATISFNNIVETYGKQCLKILNQNAFKKASNESYRTRGLEEALRIAYQAQTIIGPDKVQTDSVYHSLGELWLTFTEQQQVPLTDSQANLLNTLVLTYLEGQSGGGVSGVQSRSESPVQDMDVDMDDSEAAATPLWQKYHELCSASESLLKTL